MQSQNKKAVFETPIAVKFKRERRADREKKAAQSGSSVIERQNRLRAEAAKK